MNAANSHIRDAERTHNLNAADRLLVELDAVVEKIASDYEVTTEAALAPAALVLLAVRLEALTRGLT